MSLGILSIKNILKKFILKLKIYFFFSLHWQDNYERLSNQRTKGRSSNAIRYHSSSNHKRCLLAICLCLIFSLGRQLYVNQSLWLPGEAWLQGIMGRLAQHGKKSTIKIKNVFFVFFSYFYLLFNTIKVDFRSFLNKSQPYSLALELYHFPLNIFRQKLWHHQELVLTLLKSIEWNKNRFKWRKQK